MTIKSTDKKYGTVAVTIHWLSLLLVAALMVSGNRMTDTVDMNDKISILQLHAPIGISILILFMLRIGWWIFADKKPLPIDGGSKLQQILSHMVHYSFYVIILLLAASGIGMFILSDAAPIVFNGATTPLPDFENFAPRAPHGIFAKILLVLVVLHASAALYHQFFKKDGLLRRMWY